MFAPVCGVSCAHDLTRCNTLQHAILAVRVVSDVGYSPVIVNTSTRGGFGISVGLGNVLVF